MKFEDGTPIPGANHQVVIDTDAGAKLIHFGCATAKEILHPGKGK